MRTLFFIISKDILRRNIVDTTFWPAFMRMRGDVRVVFLVEPERETYFRERYGGDTVIVTSFKKERPRGWMMFLNFFMRSGIRSKSTTYHRWHAYRKGRGGLLSTLSKSIISNTLARTRWYKHFLRWLIQRVKQSESIRELYDTYAPDLVFAPSLSDMEVDVQFSVEARRRGIPVVGMVRSWDNLNHHGLLAFVPDRFVFQNRWLRRAAERFQAVDINRTPHNIIGLPHYDLYHDPNTVLRERDEFLASIGLDPKKKIIFLGGSEYYYSEDSLLRLLNRMIEDKTIKLSSQVLYRIHPSSIFKIDDLNLNTLKHIVLDGAHANKSSVKFTDTERFINMLYHADVTISIGSTLTIDAAAFDRPAIAVDWDDPEKHLTRWTSVHRFNDHFDHQSFMLSLRGARVPSTSKALADDINAYLVSPGLDRDGRRRILEEFAEPFDGKAGERLAGIVTEEASKAV